MAEENGLQIESLLRHHAWLGPLARSLLGDDARAEDALQDTWVAALRTEEAAAPRTAGWLRRVLSNFAFQAHRRERRLRRREQFAARREAVAITAEDLCEQAELQEVLAEAVLGLREPYRSVILYRYYRDLSPPEIARRLGVPVATVKTRLRRALDLLRERLDRRGAGEWRLALLPIGALKSPPAVPAALKMGATFMALGLKPSAIAASLVILALVLGGGLWTLFRGERNAATDPGGARAVTAVGLEAESVAGEGSAAGTADAPAGAPAPGPAVAEAPETSAIEGELATAEAGSPATARAPLAAPAGDDSEVKTEYLRLKQLFHQGGNGWARLRENLSAIRQLLSTDEGVAEVLALFDGENDDSFLEAILHHLPLNRGEHQEEILADEELHRELWSRFEEETSPARRVAYLRFFSYQPRLAEKQMDRFLELLPAEPESRVRSQLLDAIGSAGYPEKSWAPLCEVAESDPEEALRALAIEGLGSAKSERGEALVKAAFRSGSEKLRAAALRSAAGANPPADVVGSDLTAYLIGEFRSAATREYKLAIVSRLKALSPEALRSELERALRTEPDRLTKQEYRKTLEKL